MTNRTIALIVIGGGVLAIIIGLVIWAGGLSWFGRLPGDVRMDSNTTSVRIPFVSMLIISVVLTVVVNVVLRLWR